LIKAYFLFADFVLDDVMKLPFAVYTAREGYQWISGIDAGLPQLEKLRRAIGKLPEFDFGDSPSCGAVNSGDTVAVYRFMRERQGDFRGRDSLYLALTYFEKSVAGSINFDELLSLELFTSPLREPPSFLEYKGDVLVDPEFAPDKSSPEIGLDSAGMLYAKLTVGSLQLVQKEGARLCAVKYVPPLAETAETDSVEYSGLIEENPVTQLRMDPPVLRWRLGSMKFALAVLLVGILSLGCYLLWRRERAKSSEQVPKIKAPETALQQELEKRSEDHE
jgi:hypothetical protein